MADELESLASFAVFLRITADYGELWVIMRAGPVVRRRFFADCGGMNIEIKPNYSNFKRNY